MDGKKAATVCVLEILKKYSDENHYLTHQDIIQYLENDYGIVVERKAIASSIKILEELDYDVQTLHKKGTALIARDLEKSEIQFLNDAVYSSKIIPDYQAKDLVKKIMGCLSKYDQRFIESLHKSGPYTGTDNKELFYNIEVLNQAISDKKAIRFKYLKYDMNKSLEAKYSGFYYYVTPYFLVNNFGKYYLIGKYWRGDSYSMYRVDYISKIEIDNKHEAFPMNELFGNDFSIPDFVNEHVYMFGGETINAIVKFNDDNVVNYIYDWFGKAATIYVKDNKKYATIKTNENAFYYWALQYGDCIEVIEPVSLKERIIESIKNQCKKYKI